MPEDISERQAPQKPSLAKRTLEAFFWSVSGAWARNLSRVFVLILLARLLSPSDFGLVAAASTLVLFFDDFSELGIGPAIIQRPHLEPRHLQTGFTFSIVLGLLFASLVYFFAPA